MQTLRQDIAYAFRQMRQSPVFTLTAMLTLALGIGATTAIFSLIHTVMLKSLPVVDPSSLYRIGEGNDCCVEGSPQDNWGMFSYPFYELMKKNTPEFEELAAFQAGGWQISTRRSESDRIARPLRNEFVSGNYFHTFGLGAFAGRTIQPSDDQPSAAPVAMLSYRAWQQQYGSDPKVVGSNFILNGHPFTIIGITPPGFFGETLRSDPPDLWIPINQEPMFSGANSFLHHFQAWLRVIGRLKPGATVNAVPDRMTALIRQWLVNDSGMPADWMAGIKAGLPKQIVKVVPAGTGVGVMKADYGANLRILLGVCCLVLLIACANIANLLLARAASRRQQTSIRLALGASRRRLIRQALTESIVLSVLGGFAGLIVAYLGVKLIVALNFHGAKFVPIDATPSLAVLAFAFAAVSRHRRALRNRSRMVRLALRSRRGPARRQSQHPRSLQPSAKDPRRLPGDPLRRPARRRRPAHPQPHEHAAPGLRLRHRPPRHHQPHRTLQRLLAAQARRHVPRTAGSALPYARRRARRPCPVHAPSGQLGRNRHPRGPPHAQHDRSAHRLVLGSRQRRLSRNPGAEGHPRPLNYARRHRLDPQRRRRQ